MTMGLPSRSDVLDRSKDIDVPKRNVRKRKSTAIDTNQLKMAEKSNNEHATSTKKQRKPRSSGAKVESTSKSSRVSKPRANTSKSKQASSTLSPNDVVASKPK